MNKFVAFFFEKYFIACRLTLTGEGKNMIKVIKETHLILERRLPNSEKGHLLEFLVASHALGRLGKSLHAPSRRIGGSHHPNYSAMLQNLKCNLEEEHHEERKEQTFLTAI